MSISCPRCGTPAPVGAYFCEHDGTRLVPEGEAIVAPVPVTSTGSSRRTKPGCRCGAGPEAEAEGYCTVCGRKWPAVRVAMPRDHEEVVLSPTLAGVTDRGQRHARNEDDLALGYREAASGQSVLVVCDGVSSSEDAHRASAVAVKVTRDYLIATTLSDKEAALREAVAAANQAVCGLGGAPTSAVSDPPESTLVAAMVCGREAYLAWVGDSRAYWLDLIEPSASRLLTRDHSWMNDVLDSGQMTSEEAGRNRLAHAITRCLGPSDDPESQQPTLGHFPFPAGSGLLLLCSDGLWNYAPDAEMLAQLARDAPATEGAIGIARALVAWANQQGGRDNITVALQVVEAATTASL